MSSLELLRDAVVILFVCFDFLVCFEGFSFSSYIYCYSPRISTPGVRLYLRIAVDWGGKRQLRILPSSCILYHSEYSDRRG